MIIELDENNFEEQTSKGLKLVDFSAQWCVYCKMLKPVLSELDKIWIGEVDGDKSPSLARKFNVSGYPTIVFLKDGKEVDRLIGFHPKENIMDKIMKHLK